MKKRLLSMILTVSVFSACLMGCGGKGSAPNENSLQPESGTKEQAAAENSILNETGYPIVNEPITLTVGVLAPNSAWIGEWEDLDWVKQLQAESGITLEFEVYENAEAVSLMYASREYPDISWNIGNDKQIKDAAEAGDVYALDEYMEQYAPNWNAYFAENDMARKLVTSSDGHIYSFPIVRDEPQNSNLRDQWYINKTWLDELGLNIPTTMEEFYNVLKAFKENAGKGSIPENVAPYYIYSVTQNIGGALDLINSFGVRVNGAGGWRLTVDDNGKIEYNYANEAIKEPIEFIHKMVTEGLISPDCFTDDWSTFSTKINAAECNIGSFHAYSVSNPNYVAMSPLDSGNGKKPMVRSQTNAVGRNKFTVYKNCEYPEAAVRLANMIADPDWSMQGLYGMFDDYYQTKQDDGTIVLLDAETDYSTSSCPHNRVALLCSADLFEKFVYSEGTANYDRANAYYEKYEDYIIDPKNLYPSLLISDENADKLSTLNTDIQNYVNATLNSWALNGGIEEGWDDYIAQLENLGLEEFLTLLQEELDAFNAR